MQMTRFSFFLIAALFAPGPAFSDETPEARVVVPIPDAERGRFLFASKGCVVCHSINGIGGMAGPPLDTQPANGVADPVDFAARMWRGAVAMTLLQSMEFGYQVSLSGQDIANLAAFVADPAQRNAFSENDIPEVMLGWTIDEPFAALEEEWDPWGAHSQSDDLQAGRIGNMTRGHMLAERWCVACHIIDTEGEGGQKGPAFESVAARAGASERSIVDWLSVPHSAMPEFINLEERDFADLAAYIMSLKP